MENYSIHPYEPYIPLTATKLIVGTIPPYRFCFQKLEPEDVNFYYGSKDNAFWELVSEATGVQLDYVNSKEAIEQRKNLLCKLNIGVTDVIESCIHHDQKSDDNSLEIIELKKIKESLLQCPKINTLLYTSEYVKTLINQKFADKSYHCCIDKSRRKYTTVINGKEYDVVILYSPSPSALRRVKAKTRLTQYKTVFGG